jgi:Short C-terminal domain
MPLMRRRPLLRAAAVGGVAYMGARAGTNRAMQDAEGAPAVSEPANAAPQPGAAAASGASDRIALLQQLAQLHDSGALTDEEFAAEKAKVLA